MSMSTMVFASPFVSAVGGSCSLAVSVRAAMTSSWSLIGTSAIEGAFSGGGVGESLGCSC